MSQVTTPTQNLLVIDSHVSNWQSLASGVKPDTAVLIIDSGSDGLTQISNYLAALTNAGTQNFVPLQSLQIISHGSAGSLLLGSSTITTSNLSLYSKQLASIGSNLTDTGDILLYGCDVAADKPGLDFVNQIAALTSADVAASNDVTGSATLGGNWQLEVATGTIESALALNTATLNSYTNTLDISVFDGNSELFMSVYDSSSKNTYSFDTGLTIDTFITAAGNSTYTYTYDLSLDANWTSGFLGASGFNAATTTYALAVGSKVNPDVLLTSSAVGGLVLTDVVDTLVSNIQIQAGQINYNLTGLSKVVNDSGVANTGQFNLFDIAFGLQTGAQVAGAYGSTLAFFHGTNVPNAAGEAQESHIEQFAGSWKLTDNTLSFGYQKPVNNAPVFTSGATGSVDENAVASTVIYTAATSDVNNTFTLSGTDAGSLTITAGVVTLKTSADFEAKTSYSFNVIANDGLNNTTQAVVVSVNNLNDNVPTFTSGITGSVNENAPITTVIYTAATTDVDNLLPVTYTLGGADLDLLFIDAVSGVVTLKTSANFEAKTSYNFNVIANDGSNNSTQAVVVSVNNLNDNVPTFTSGITGSVNENAPITTVIYTAATTDADNLLAVTYTLSGDDVALLDINATTGAVTLKEVANFEAKPSYSFNVIASDGTLTTPLAVVVSVVNLNDNAPVFTSNTTGSVNENAPITTVIYTAVTTDADNLLPVTYTLSGDDVALLDINATTGAVTLKASANFEAKPNYSFNVIASDGTLTTPQAVVVSVVNPKAPVFTSGTSGSVDENVAISTPIYTAITTDADNLLAVTYTLGGDDVALLDINTTTGGVTLKEAANFEVKPSYSFKVIASDGTLTTPQAVVVSVNNLNDNAPVFTSGATGSVDEKAATAMVIYTAATTDADKLLAATYTLGGTDASLLDITAGVVTLKASADYETKTSYNFNVIANDGGSNNTTQVVVVSVNNLNDNAPVFTSGTSGSVDENAPITTVIYTAEATDADNLLAATYTLGGADLALLDINTTTGAVTLKNSADFETKTSYNFNVIANDGNNNTTQAVVVSVNNMNDTPTGTVTITGTPTQNQILTATNTLVNADGLGPITYQWLADSTAISGVTASTLTLGQAQVGKTITVKAGYTDLLGTPESVSSAATTKIVNVNDAPTTSTVTLAAIAEHSQARVITQAELLGNAADLDNNSLTATSLSIASGNGTLVDNLNGTWNYTPLLNDATSVSFNYTITDSVSPDAGTVAGTATLDITPVILSAVPVADLFKSFGNGTNTYIKPEAYNQNPVLNLKYQLLDNTPDAVIIGSTSNDFIKLGGAGNKAANGGGGNDVIDGGTGSSFLTGGDGIETFFLDGRAAGVTWSTLTDFNKGQDHATIWGWVKGVSKIDAGFADFNTGGAAGYTGLTLHIQNLLPDGSASGATNSELNSLTLTGHTLAEFGATSLADLNNQIASGTNTHFIVGQTTDNLGVHGYLSIS